MRRAHRLDQVPPYLFAQLDKKKAEAQARGVDVISLGIGDPDQPTPENVVRSLQREVEHAPWHRYPDYEGSPAFRQAAARWLKERFGVEVDPATQVMALIGSKEGLAHIVWAYVDPGDTVLVPDPGYPVYGIHTLLAGGQVYSLPLRAENGFLPDYSAIPGEVARRAKLLFLNYPNNPTAAVADLDFFRETVAFAQEYDILVCHDAAYSEITFDGYVAPSILQVPGAEQVAVEFHSLSKPFNMTGWRIGFAAGNREAIEALGIIKTNTDSGQFTAIQFAAIEALQGTPGEFLAGMRALYRRRRDDMVEALRGIGIDVVPPRGTFYIWAPVPAGYTSESFATAVLEQAGVVVTPGNGYGPAGEGFFRISLTAPDERLAEAVRRIRDRVRL